MKVKIVLVSGRNNLMVLLNASHSLLVMPYDVLAGRMKECPAWMTRAEHNKLIAY